MPDRSRAPVRLDFYPRSPCGERRALDGSIAEHIVFLSTLSLRRATQQAWDKQANFIFLSTLSLRRATRYHLKPSNRKGISIHALLAESDLFHGKMNVMEHLFLSTLSLRRATQLESGRGRIIGISIHALLAESDELLGVPAPVPRRFLSTLSLRRAT